MIQILSAFSQSHESYEKQLSGEPKMLTEEDEAAEVLYRECIGTEFCPLWKKK